MFRYRITVDGYACDRAQYAYLQPQYFSFPTLNCSLIKPSCQHLPDSCAQCRFVIYKKNIERLVAVESPKVLGGLKSEAYLALNPQGLMPLLALPDGTSLPESQVIASRQRRDHFAV